MKIAIIKRKFLETGGGGAEKYAQIVCRGLSARGHEISILGQQFSEERLCPYEYISVPESIGISTSGTFRFHKNVQKYLDSANLRNKFDIIYSLSRTYPSDVFRATEQIHAEWLKQNRSKLQLLNPRHRGILKLEKCIYDTSNTKAIVTISQLYKDLIAEIYNYPEEQIFTIANGVDKKNFFPAPKEEKKVLRKKLFNNISDDKLILLLAGSNFEIKGLKTAIQAIAKLDKPFADTVSLFVLGGDNPEPFKKFAEEYHVAAKLFFAGERTNMRDYLVAGDLFLFPSQGESFGNVCLEAAACGLPVINTKQNGSCELIQNGKNGYIIDSSYDIDKMAESIIDFIKLSKQERKQFSQLAIKSTENYSWEQHVISLEKLFNTF